MANKHSAEQVDEAILAFAAKKGFTLVAGTTHEARISEDQRIQLPRKTQEPEEYLGVEPKAARKQALARDLHHNTAKLRRIWKGDESDPGRITKVLKPFVSQDTVTTLRFRALATED